MSKPKPRIDTNAGETSRPGLNAAFSSLELDAPAAPETPAFPQKTAPASHWKPGRVVLRRERAHRGGKTVTVVDDFGTHLPPSFIEALAKRLRASCGCGGAVKGRTVEVQGEQVAKIRGLLEAEGFAVAGVR